MQLFTKLLSFIKFPIRFCLFALASAVLLVSCGGGGGSQCSVCVTDIQVDRLSYNQTSNFKIIGTALSAGTALALSADKCSSITVLNTSTDTEVNVSCTVNATGSLTFQAKDTSGSTLLTKTLTVPEPQVTLVTTLGTLVVELNPTLAPLSVSNYLQYVHDGFYTNTLIHRVADLSGGGSGKIIAQGGQFTAAPAEQTGVRAAIANEGNNGLSNVRGTIAMARTSVMNSATSQFYFNVTDNAAELGQTGNEYAVFGKLTQGLTVLDAIGSSATGGSNIAGNILATRPLVDIVLQSVTQTQ